ncbi:NAD-dependent epimerase/dehydratase family protein [candidate division KSB3 bacterium]|uniref:NAD-dependent epimerase/dehydratase family protein n=1 Tax=candidate division KSB3 bacterium TaxID=2044937 RepID=A0A9D5Q7F7_9BACT|nr:NAD-dependent epimerase/dehydratase family protein [candidate division KSB3 bacterium]MBD3326849.1 NAD-dependent epimerase/dehydratase family protein [candidate division KSB3 bacterium]
MSEKIVVLGSNSFSGAHFVEHALQHQAEVIGISRSPEPHPVFLPYKKCQQPAFHFYQADLNHDLDRIMEIMYEFQPDYIINFAAQGMVAQSWQHPEHWMQTNIVANVKLHDKLRHCQFLKKYVHISTPEVYGSCQGLIQEHTHYNPSTPYAVSKAAIDMSLMTFFRAYQFPVVFTRAANVYGSGQQLYRIIPRTILYFLTGKTLQLHGGGHAVRSFIHIRDVADGTLRAARQGIPGEIYHFSTDRNISIRSLVCLIAEHLQVSFHDHVDIVDDRLGKDSAYLLDSTKAQKMLGWKDQIDLEAGIEEMILWMKEYLDQLTQQPLEYLHKP